MDVELASVKGISIKKTPAQMQFAVKSNVNNIPSPRDQVLSSVDGCPSGFRCSTFMLVVCSFMLMVPIVYQMGFSLFTFHPLLMIVGWVLFGTEGMFALKPKSVWNPRSLKRNTQREWHRVVQISCCVCCVIGLLVIVCNKSIHGKSIIPTTLHGCCGFMTIGFLVLQCCVGIYKLKTLKESGIKKFRWHGLAGKIGYGLAILTMVLGTMEILYSVELLVSLLCYGVLTCTVFVLYTCNKTHAPYSPLP